MDSKAHLAALSALRMALLDFESHEFWEMQPEIRVDDDETPHPLWLAVVNLQGFYRDNRLPDEVTEAWVNLRAHSRQRGERVWEIQLLENCEILRKWVVAEIDRVRTLGDPAANVAHSPDFRSVRWFGKRYTFTTTQAACVEVLWRNWIQGTPVLSEVTILDEAGSGGSRLRDVFDKGEHSAWDTLIVSAGKGAYQLAEPNES